jgi:hypothetical protein
LRYIREHLLGKQYEVVGPLAQRGDLHSNHRDTKEEVSSEPAVARSCLEVAIRRADDARSKLERTVGAYSLEAPLLEHMEELGLAGQRELADLVQDNCPPARRFERADTCGNGPRERSAFMTKELAFDEGLWKWPRN